MCSFVSPKAIMSLYNYELKASIWGYRELLGPEIKNNQKAVAGQIACNIFGLSKLLGSQGTNCDACKICVNVCGAVVYYCPPP
jgi:hypothetical protein